MSFILGLTGQTGAGKSVAAEISKSHGFFVVDCDKLAHEVLESQEGKRELVAVFGTDILENDVIARPRLAAAAFKSAEATKLLNKTILPLIVNKINIIIDEKKADFVLLDAPTLFESGANALCDKTIGVVADKDIRFKRIIERDNLSELAAIQRINAGKDNEFYIQNCDFVLQNNSTDTEFINNFENMLNDILKGRQN